VTAFALGVQLVRARLLALSSLVGLALALATVALLAFLERRTGARVAADRALVGPALGIVLPLLAHGAVARALGAARLDTALESIGRFGGSRRAGALGVAVATAAVLAACGAVISGLAVLVVRAPADPRLVRDMLTSGWVGALAGASYAGWFCLASTLGKRGGGRGVALVLDFVLGAGAGAAALLWPRGHIRNLLGAEPVMGMPQWSATAVLSTLAVVYVGLCLSRVRR
jgi:hypothetical protein